MGPFDLIFCRNVATYFNPEARRGLFESIANYLAPGGMLVIGSTKTLIGVTKRLQQHKDCGSIYYTVSRDPLFQ